MKSKILISIFTTIFFTSIGYSQLPDLASLMGSKTDPSLVPDAYQFSWKYNMEIKTAKGTLNASYLLKKDATYFGMSTAIQGNEMFMIMDTKNKINVTAFGSGVQKMAMASKAKDFDEIAAKEGTGKKFTYKPLPGKTILGYACKGISATNEDMEIVFYYTNDAPVNFADLFKSPQGQQMPAALKDYFKPSEKPLMLSVDINDKVKDSKTTMTCTSLKEEAFIFQKADYKFM